MSVEERILDIELVKRPMSSSNNSKQASDSDKFGSGGEGLMIVKAFLLGVAFSH